VRVSVVIPTWNRASTLARAVSSAAAQSPAEVVVIDDASTDDTPSIVEQLQSIYPCVRYVRHAEKSADWQEASAAVYPSLIGTQVVIVGSDDALLGGIVASLEKHSEAAVVFHDYFVANTESVVTHLVQAGYPDETTLTPGKVCERITNFPYPTETGIGAGIRKEHLLWLATKRFWEMGPWSDCMGYAVVAALHGCVYVPKPLAVFTDDSHGYGNTNRISDQQAKFFKACRTFVDSVGLPPDVRQRVLTRRQVPYA
jgi:thiamine phosphate synthase YjbQ (UPF0047 family)